jgi:hypothetical protein
MGSGQWAVGSGQCHHWQHLKCAPRNFMPLKFSELKAEVIMFRGARTHAFTHSLIHSLIALGSGAVALFLKHNPQTPKPLNP